MKDSTVVLILVAAGLVGIAAMAVGAYNLLSDLDDEDPFELTSTKVTMLAGEEHNISVACLPRGADKSDITWTSSDTSVATVYDGVVHSVALGETVVSASVSYGGETYSQECRIVVTDSVESKLVSYDAYSKNDDYAVLSGEGFEKGLLSLTFNDGGSMVISLCGYDRSWLTLGGASKKFIGCASVDFDSIDMIILRDGDIIARSVFEYGKETTDNTPYKSNLSAYTSLMAVKDLKYGTYLVLFVLHYGTGTTSVEGAFDYREGDGYRDCTENFTRTYSWRCDRTGLALGQTEARSITVTYDYEEYFSDVLRNSKNLRKYSNGIVNENNAMKADRFVEKDGNVKALADALVLDYKAAYGTSVVDDQKFAAYVLQFLQICYAYEYDNVQYYKFAEKYSEGTDYWAYANETIFSSAGDCEDTSILLCSLYECLGFRTGLVGLPGHMAGAIHLGEYTEYSKLGKAVFKAFYDGETYYFCETTTSAPIIQYAHPVTGTDTKTYVTSVSNVRDDTALVKYTYSSALIGNFSGTYIGEEFTFCKA